MFFFLLIQKEEGLLCRSLTHRHGNDDDGRGGGVMGCHVAAPREQFRVRYRARGGELASLQLLVHIYDILQTIK